MAVGAFVLAAALEEAGSKEAILFKNLKGIHDRRSPGLVAQHNCDRRKHTTVQPIRFQVALYGKQMEKNVTLLVQKADCEQGGHSIFISYCPHHFFLTLA